MDRQHLEFLAQFVLQKHYKIQDLSKEVNDPTQKKTNKTVLQEQILEEKKLKFQNILGFALSAIGGMYLNRRTSNQLVRRQAFAQSNPIS